MDWLCLVPAAAEIELLVERRNTGEALIFTETLGALIGAKLAYQIGGVPLGLALAMGIFVGTTALILGPLVAGLAPVIALPALTVLGLGTAVPAAVIAALLWHDVRVAVAEQLFAGVLEAAASRSSFDRQLEPIEDETIGLSLDRAPRVPMSMSLVAGVRPERRVLHYVPGVGPIVYAMDLVEVTDTKLATLSTQTLREPAGDRRSVRAATAVLAGTEAAVTVAAQALLAGAFLSAGADAFALLADAGAKHPSGTGLQWATLAGVTAAGLGAVAGGLLLSRGALTAARVLLVPVAYGEPIAEEQPVDAELSEEREDAPPPLER